MTPCPPPPADVIDIRWGLRIPLRDGIDLNATLYLPPDNTPAPAVVTMTPYIAQTYHDVGMALASEGFPFLAVDVRGRGNSAGEFMPNLNEGKDGAGVVEWIARQPWCDGKVAMWGGSYSGLNQWNTAAHAPNGLATIVPVASPCIAVDFPIRNNIAAPYLMQWLTLVAGRCSQDQMFWGQETFWGSRFAAWHKSGTSFRNLDRFLGMPSEIFQTWLDHPESDAYWDRYSPTVAQYKAIDLPVLTITGIYDGDQPGALAHYRAHLAAWGPNRAPEHYLVIGPWDHSGTRKPKRRFVGLEVGPASLLDLPALHAEWYRWTMCDGLKPGFLRDRISYYVMVAEEWRYASSLDAVTGEQRPLFLSATSNPADVYQSGQLGPVSVSNQPPSHYIYDPTDLALADLEVGIDPESRADQRMVLAARDRHLVYHSDPFDEDTDVCGFFELTVWLAIDTPDTDFRAAIYDVALDGTSVLITSDARRARYREDERCPRLIERDEPLVYRFDSFTFAARTIREGHRLRLVFGPINSIYSQRNYNSGGAVAEETAASARTVTVRLFHDGNYPSALTMPVGAKDTGHV